MTSKDFNHDLNPITIVILHELGFEKDQVENSIDVQSKVSREFVTGVAKTNTKKLILLLDIGKTLSVSDIALIKKQG